MNPFPALTLFVLLSLYVVSVWGGAPGDPHRRRNVDMFDSDIDSYDDEYDFDSDDDGTENEMLKGQQIEKGKEEPPSSSKERISKALAAFKPKMRLFFRKHHPSAVVASVFIYKFRKQVFRTLQKLVSDEIYHPETGKLVMQSIRFDKVIQLVVFLYVVKVAFLSDEDDDTEDEQESSSVNEAFLFGPSGIRSSLLLAKLVKSKRRNPAFLPVPMQHYTFEILNNRYMKDQWAFDKALGETNFTVGGKDKPRMVYNNTTVVLDWTNLDTRVSNLPILRDEVSFLLSIRKRHRIGEIVILLASPGGSAADYAVAAAQVRRLRKVTPHVTICVDTVAASGGYMVAVAGTKIMAAPFAVVGSIGVIGQIINVQKLLEGWGIAPLVFRGGTHKAPVGMIGEVTEDGTSKVQAMIDVTHNAFRRHVVECRPQTEQYIAKIGNGDVVLGWDAMALGMVDRVVTSDEYLQERMDDGTLVLRLHRVFRRGLFMRPVVISDVNHSSLPHQLLQKLGTRAQKAFQFLMNKGAIAMSSTDACLTNPSSDS